MAKNNQKPTKKEVLSSPLLKKGGQHGKSKKAQRQQDKAKLKSEYDCPNILAC